jgi:hypothetical protein
MQLYIEAKLANVFKPKERTNEKGETLPQKWQLQFIETIETEEGNQMILHKVSIPDEKLKQYEDKIGEIVRVLVKPYGLKPQSGFYGI